MSENSDRYCRAIDQFGRIVLAAPAARWDSPSPCTEWTARDVAGHVIAVLHAIAATIDGQRAPMNPMKEPRRYAGEDPVAAWHAAYATVTAAIAEPTVLDRIVSTWQGEVTVDNMLGYNVADPTVHAWDLARALGLDDRLDPELVEASLAVLAPLTDSMRQLGAVGTEVTLAGDADPQARLLAMMGRTT